jgi:serine/threonine protein phosphatase PrpC
MHAGGASNVGEIHLELNQPNQDNFLLNDNNRLYAVFDGHGENGHDISSFLKNNLEVIFSKALHPSTSIVESLRSTFRSLDETICKSTKSESSGSTCAVAYVADDALYIAGVGDCTAIFAQADKTSNTVTTTALLPAHKLTNLSEMERIARSGAAVAGEYIVCKTDPNKVINMTRALGDQDMKSAGIIPQPEISVTRLYTPPSSPNSNTPISFQLGDDQQSINTDSNTLNNDSNSQTPTDSLTDIRLNGAENSDDVKYFDTLFSSPQAPKKDSFLILTSDGLDQVDLKETANQAYRLLKERLSNSNETVDMSLLCSNLLQKLEDDLYERDGTGFSDDATIIVIPLSGFSST